MGRGGFGRIAADLPLIAQQAAGGDAGRRGGNWSWLADPRTAVLFVLGAIVLIGGGRRLAMAARGRWAVDRLADPEVSPVEILDAAEHGRGGLIDFFRLLDEGKSPQVRDAAGRALALVWSRDDLIPEEEKAVVTRGFDVRWRARRRYPRAMSAPIPIEVSYGLPFLRDDGGGIAAGDLEWSHRIDGAERAALELPSEWKAGAGRAAFTVDPRDFPGNGPHRLILKARARTGRGLTSDWEVELPHVPFPFEFDPRLAPEALFTLPDDSRAEAMAEAARLVPPSGEGDEPRFLDLDGEFVLRDPPAIRVGPALPSDLAHRVEIEFEGVPGRFGAGQVVVTGQGGAAEIPIGPIVGLPAGAIGRPGERRLRAVLRPDPDLGWADPDVRSLWPGSIESDWHVVRVIRR